MRAGTTSKRTRRKAWPSLNHWHQAALFLALVLGLIGTPAQGQQWQFAFDANGNLTVQSTPTSAPPQILAQPRDQTVAPGASASFLVIAAQPHNLAYQWQFNGADIAGATNDTLLITNVSPLHVGDYSVVLVNGAGSLTSSAATLSFDGDHDGLPDSWETAHFGGLSQQPTGDYDGDGVSNEDEYRDGTDPGNPSSRLYQLTVISDGGQVTVSPSRFRFTNGEMVTLTATAFAPNTFHGWTGATNTTSSSITLLMTADRTVFAHLGSYDITWTNAVSGNWDVASNWSPNFVPGTNDNAIIASGVTVTLNNDADCAGLYLSSGATLTGPGRLTLHRDSVWASGSMTGVGRTIFGPDATLSIDSSGSKSLSGGRVLENAGTMRWNGGTIQIASNTLITNRPGALFLVQSATAFTAGQNVGRFDNAGLFRKTSAGTTTFNDLVAFNNYGVAEIASGTLSIAGGGSSAGAMEISAGATLQFTAGSFGASAASSITGAGNLLVTGGTVSLAGLVNVRGNNTFDNGTANLTGNYICTNNTLTVSGGTANFSGTGTVSPALVNQDSGTMGGNQLLTVLNQMNWTGGTMSGAGRTVIPPGATLNIGNTVSIIGGRTLDNGGTILWTGGNIAAGSSVVMTNRPGALFEVRNAAGLNYSSLVGARFDNAGTFRKTVSAGTTTVFSGMTFNNFNSVQIQAGTLNLGGGSHTGTFDVPAGTALNLRGTQVSSSGSSITGAGSLTVGGGTATLGGLVNVSGTNFFDSGTANLTGNYICTNNTLVLSGGTVNFNGTGVVSPSLVLQDSGTMGGNQAITVLNQMNWTGGTMTGVGRTTIPAGATLNIGNTVSLTGGRTLDNEGTVLWTAGNIAVGSSVVMTNRPGALFEVRNAAGLNYSGLTGGRFDNAGTFRKTVSPGTTMVFSGMAFNNFNIVQIQVGTLNLGGGSHTGTFDVPAGTALNLRGTQTSSSGSSITGAGSLTVGGGTATLGGLVNVSGTNLFDSGTAHLTGNYICTNNTLVLSGGTVNFNGTGVVSPALVLQDSGTMGGNQAITVLNQMNWTGGTMTGLGRTIIASGATLNIGNTISLSGGRTLDNGGMVLWTGGNIATGTTVVMTNRPGALFEVRNAAGLNYSGLIGARFDNAGTFRKSVSTGTTTIFNGMAFNNLNRVEIKSGILLANGGYSSRTNALLHCSLGGTNVGTGYARLQVAGTVALAGGLDVSFVNGFQPATNDAFTVVTAGTRTGGFTSFQYPSNAVSMQMSNTANSVVLRVTALLDSSEIQLLTPELAGPDVRLTWTTVSNQTYRVEYTSHPGFTNWIALPGDTISVSTNAMKLDTLTSSNRFYRVRLLP